MNWIYLLLGLFIGLYIKSFIDTISLKLAVKLFLGDDRANKEMRDSIVKKSRFQERIAEMQKLQDEQKAKRNQ